MLTSSFVWKTDFNCLWENLDLYFGASNDILIVCGKSSFCLSEDWTVVLWRYSKPHVSNSNTISTLFLSPKVKCTTFLRYLTSEHFVNNEFHSDSLPSYKWISVLKKNWQLHIVCNQVSRSTVDADCLCLNYYKFSHRPPMEICWAPFDHPPPELLLFYYIHINFRSCHCSFSNQGIYIILWDLLVPILSLWFTIRFHSILPTSISSLYASFRISLFHFLVFFRSSINSM